MSPEQKKSRNNANQKNPSSVHKGNQVTNRPNLPEGITETNIVALAKCYFNQNKCTVRLTEKMQRLFN
jgi:hypothetical protein